MTLRDPYLMAALCVTPALPPLPPGPVRHAHPAAECALPALGSPGHLALAHRQVSPLSPSWVRLKACSLGLPLHIQVGVGSEWRPCSARVGMGGQEQEGGRMPLCEPLRAAAGAAGATWGWLVLLGQRLGSAASGLASSFLLLAASCLVSFSSGVKTAQESPPVAAWVVSL